MQVLTSSVHVQKWHQDKGNSKSVRLSAMRKVNCCGWHDTSSDVSLRCVTTTSTPTQTRVGNDVIHKGYRFFVDRRHNANRDP